MSERMTRRAALAGGVALSMVPAAAMAREESAEPTEVRIEALLEEFRRRLARVDAEPLDDEALDTWCPSADEPFFELSEVTPSTLHGMALQIQAHAIRQGDPWPFGDEGAANLSDKARAILGLPAGQGDRSEWPSRREHMAAGKTLQHYGIEPDWFQIYAALGKPPSLAQALEECRADVVLALVRAMANLDDDRLSDVAEAHPECSAKELDEMRALAQTVLAEVPSETT